MNETINQSINTTALSLSYSSREITAAMEFYLRKRVGLILLALGITPVGFTLQSALMRSKCVVHHPGPIRIHK